MPARSCMPACMPSALVVWMNPGMNMGPLTLLALSTSAGLANWYNFPGVEIDDCVHLAYKLFSYTKINGGCVRCVCGVQLPINIPISYS